MTLSPPEQEAMKFIRWHIGMYGYAPTQREVGEAAGCASSSDAHHLLRRLRAQGLVDWTPNTPRSLHLLEAA